MDVLFVDFPRDFLFPVSEWCLGYRYLISSLQENGFSANLLHPRRCPDGSTKRRLIDDILRANSSIVGFTTYDAQLRPLLAFINELRRAGLRSHVTLGGMCASAIPEHILQKNPAVDSVVFGEGELSIVDLARHVIRKDGPQPIPGVCLRDRDAVVSGEARPLIEDLDTLPAPAYDDFENPHEKFPSPLYHVNGCIPVVASRGCYARCTFCCIQRFYRSCPGKVWRGRSAASIAGEIANMTRLTGFDKVTFVDENFMGPGIVGRRHATEIAHEIKRQRLPLRFNFGCRPNDLDPDTIKVLKEAGLAAVTLGIESMSPDALELFNKSTTPRVNYDAVQLLEALEIYAEITFIFFHPLSTLSEIRDNLSFIDFVRNSRYAYFNKNQPFSEFIPFFGTELTRRFEETGLVKRDLEGYSVKYADPRVGFIARRILDVPVDYLSRMWYAFPVDGSQRLKEIQASLVDYEVYLNMDRLPSLVSDLCDLFERGAQISSRKVRTVVAELDQETERIYSLVRRFVSHVP